MLVDVGGVIDLVNGVRVAISATNGLWRKAEHADLILYTRFLRSFISHLISSISYASCSHIQLQCSDHSLRNTRIPPVSCLALYARRNLPVYAQHLNTSSKDGLSCLMRHVL